MNKVLFCIEILKNLLSLYLFIYDKYIFYRCSYVIYLIINYKFKGIFLVICVYFEENFFFLIEMI